MSDLTASLDVRERWTEDGVAEGYLLVGRNANELRQVQIAFHGLIATNGDEPTIPIIFDEYDMKGKEDIADPKYSRYWSGLVSGGGNPTPRRPEPSHFLTVKQDLVTENSNFVAALVHRREEQKELLRQMSGRFGQIVLDGAILTVTTTDRLGSLAEEINVAMRR